VSHTYAGSQPAHANQHDAQQRPVLTCSRRRDGSGWWPRRDTKGEFFFFCLGGHLMGPVNIVPYAWAKILTGGGRVPQHRFNHPLEGEFFRHTGRRRLAPPLSGSWAAGQLRTRGGVSPVFAKRIVQLPAGAQDGLRRHILFRTTATPFRPCAEYKRIRGKPRGEITTPEAVNLGRARAATVDQRFSRR